MEVESFYHSAFWLRFPSPVVDMEFIHSTFREHVRHCLCILDIICQFKIGFQLANTFSIFNPEKAGREKKFSAEVRRVASLFCDTNLTLPITNQEHTSEGFVHDLYSDGTKLRNLLLGKRLYDYPTTCFILKADADYNVHILTRFHSKPKLIKPWKNHHNLNQRVLLWPQEMHISQHLQEILHRPHNLTRPPITLGQGWMSSNPVGTLVAQVLSWINNHLTIGIPSHTHLPPSNPNVPKDLISKRRSRVLQGSPHCLLKMETSREKKGQFLHTMEVLQAFS